MVHFQYVERTGSGKRGLLEVKKKKRKKAEYMYWDKGAFYQTGKKRKCAE